MNDIILTIAIPTYNRSSFLDCCLNSITKQINGNNKVELIVSNNASTDDTESVIQKYITSGIKINYETNITNLGAEGNVVKCYNSGIGKYVWVIGDDDVMLDGALAYVLDILESTEELDLLALKWKIGTHTITEYGTPQGFLFTNPLSFLRIVSHNITFISSSIINRKHIANIPFEKNMGSQLPQLSFSLTALTNAKRLVYINENIIGVAPDNSGGYNVCTVFGPNINQVIDRTVPQDLAKSIKNILNKGLILECFPFWIQRIKQNINNNFLDKGDLKPILQPVFKGYYTYWIFLHPLLNSNHSSFNTIWKTLKYLRILLNKYRSVKRYFTLYLTGKKITIN